jgi:hypothetical protein
MPHLVTPQAYNQTFSQTYTRQLPCHDPWTGQGPPRNPIIPQSGMAVFDPASDHMIYNDFGNFGNVDDWRMNNTDPNYLVSPNDPVGLNHDNLFIPASQHPVHAYSQPHVHLHNHNPVEMRLTLASPSPDSQNFVNYNSSSSLFTDNYITESQCPPPSPGASSYGQDTQSPYQPPLSPQASATSPGGSEGMFSSYQRSDGGLQVEAYPRERFEHRHSPSATQALHASMIIPDVAFDPSPEPESRRAQSISSRGAGHRPGGRALGTHLNAKVAKEAHDMRKITACWHCVLQRDKVRSFICLFLRISELTIY